mmetsp:Transcript_712/g.1533  ORF Transcript_712/g.1533 Transcript_712/m.1533 type:complete len:338 (+) Transcript_712:131-1144(+)
MRSIALQAVAFFFLTDTIHAFHNQICSPRTSRNVPKTPLSMSSYLDSLSDFHVSQPPPSWTPPPIPTVSSSDPTSTNNDNHNSDNNLPPRPTFHHAQLDYFAIDLLSPPCPRKNADVGTPCDSYRELCDLDSTSAGSWYCSSGGWPSPNPRSTTEVFYVLDGHGRLIDEDGMEHYFGPGDTVILPKGWSGRWDVLENVRKVWFVHEHDDVKKENDETIRVIVVPYNELTTMEMQFSYGTYKLSTRGKPDIFSSIVYSVGPTKAGCWICTPGGLKIENLNMHHGFHVLEGVMYITDEGSEMGQSRMCVAGDLVVLPKGWSGYLDVVETVRKLWTTLDA